MSAQRENGRPGQATPEPISVLFTLHQNMNTLDFAGTCEVLSRALHDLKDEESKAFDLTFASGDEHIVTAQGASFRAHISFREAQKRLGEFDVLVVPGGGVEKILEDKSEPLELIRAFADLQEADPTRERTILSVDTGSLLVAAAGCLQGLSATTHPDYMIKLELICQEASQKGMDARTDVMEGERYVVNNGRFDLGDNLDDNPFVFRKKGANKTDGTAARKGSEARRQSMARRENILRRAEMRLGGMRVITAGGSSCGLDATFYLVSALVSHASATEVARQLQFEWRKGVVVDSIDV